MPREFETSRYYDKNGEQIIDTALPPTVTVRAVTCLAKYEQKYQLQDNSTYSLDIVTDTSDFQGIREYNHSYVLPSEVVSLTSHQHHLVRKKE